MTSAMVADITTAETRAYFNGLMGAVIGLGFVVGPAMGGVLHVLLVDRRRCLLFAAAGSLLALLLGVATIPETLPPNRRRGMFASSATQTPDETHGLLHHCKPTNKRRGSHNYHNGGGGVSYLGLVMMCLTRFCLSFATAVMGSTYYMLLQDTYSFGRPDRQLSKVLSITGLCVVIYQGCLFRRVAQRLGAHATMIVGSLLLALGIGVAAHSVVSYSLTTHIVLYSLTYSVAYALIEPNIPTISSLYADYRHQGIAHGSVNSCRFLATIIAPIIYGRLYAAFHLFPFAIAVATSFLPSVFVLIARFGATPQSGQLI
eukprot:GHVS01094434.1.p1 GENE.GHVS01094434.1~~GHVS01094434.1.p1  ORF type:complete len:316 (+),score=52.35 GHVS01094434.1:185-1132(+)